MIRKIGCTPERRLGLTSNSAGAKLDGIVVFLSMLTSFGLCYRYFRDGISSPGNRTLVKPNRLKSRTRIGYNLSLIHI